MFERSSNKGARLPGRIPACLLSNSSPSQVREPLWPFFSICRLRILILVLCSWGCCGDKMSLYVKLLEQTLKR